ncbi:MAG: thioredoxin family protein [Sulfolobaceae archaeon]|nr:thioredoxin family protein [Sulfolobaceae archaeon]
MSVEEDPELQELLNRKLKQLLIRAEQKEERKKFKGGVVHHLDSNSLREFLSEFKTAVIDFWADWCPPCHLLSPIVEELANEYRNIGFGKVDVKRYPEIASYYGVVNLPTLLIFYEGNPVDYIIGAVPKEYIQMRLSRLN